MLLLRQGELLVLMVVCFLNADNEGQFSSVIAHELAHLSQRHFARNVLNAKDRSLSIILSNDFVNCISFNK